MNQPQRIAVVCDFDGTITTEDQGVLLLQEFAPPEWMDWGRDFEAGNITDQQCVTGQFALVKASLEEMLRFALSQVRIRAGAPQFFERCREQSIPVTVASNGLDFYIEPILQHFSLPFEALLCGRGVAGNGEGVSVSYAHLTDGAYPDEADHKRLAVQRYRSPGRLTVFIGDGIGDYLAAALADAVFARGRLLERCLAGGVACTPFEDFGEILAAMQGSSGVPSEARLRVEPSKG